MAALPEWPELKIADLRRISPDDLGPLLAEEIVAWRSSLDWDLHSSVDLVRRFVRLQSLNGCALIDRGRVIGYAYYVTEDHKGLIGDLYIVEKERTRQREAMLLEACLDSMWRTPGVRRVEAQLLLLDAQDGSVPYRKQLRSFPRWYMQMRTAGAVRLPARDLGRIEISAWMEAYREVAANLVAAAYKGHIDSEINDQYRSQSGARRFLNNIIEYPGCGTFFGPASFVAGERRTGGLCGLSLASLVAADSGHITQVCVSPDHRNEGLGYELLRRSVLSLAAHGCSTVSLTVTAANTGAIQLYERMGFTKRRAFSACVWELS